MERTGAEQPAARMPSAQSDGEPVALHADRQTIMAVQRKLQDEGHDPGTVDGQWGESTQAAIRSYQQESGDLSATGQLTLPTLAALDIDIQDADHIDRERPSDEEPRERSDAGSDQGSSAGKHNAAARESAAAFLWARPVCARGQAAMTLTRPGLDEDGGPPGPPR